ncbi:MAG: hypothetical protein DRN96_02925, partial [Thermoproteota archaeon]
MDERSIEKVLAEVLKSGGDILAEVCPNCRVPLVRVRGEVYCPKCGKRVLLVKTDYEAIAQRRRLILEELEDILLVQLDKAARSLKEDLDEDQLRSIIYLLDALKRTEDVKKSVT